MPNPPKPYDWSKIIVLDECCTEEQRKAFITVLNDMARDPDGIKIFETLEKNERKIFLTEPSNRGLGELRSEAGPYERLGTVLDFSSSPDSNEAKMIEHILDNHLNFVPINFEELKSHARVEDNTGRLIPYTLNYVLSHELEHIAYAGPASKLHYELHDIEMQVANNIISQKERELYHLEKNNKITTEESNKILEKFIADHPEENEALQKLNVRIEKCQEKISTSSKEIKEYEDEKNADRGAGAYCKNEPSRNSYAFTVKLKNPLDKVIVYENGNFDLDEYSRQIKEKNGSSFVSEKDIKFLSRVPAERFRSVEFKTDLDASIKNLISHDIKFTDFDKVGGLSTFERNILKGISDTLLKE